MHEPSLRRVLRSLACLGLFTEPGPGQVALTPLGRTLAGGHPESSMRDVAITWMETHYAAFSELAGTVRSGQPAFDRYHGIPVLEWFGAHPTDVQTFSPAMANLTDGIRPGVVASLRLDGIRTLVDVGGADGALLAAILAGPRCRRPTERAARRSVYGSRHPGEVLRRAEAGGECRGPF